MVPTRDGEPAVVNVIVGLPDAVAGTGTGTATIAGSGAPLPAEAVADLLDHGARIRIAFIALRDVTARTPSGSAAPVAGQDLDHIDSRGPTEPGNLHPPTRGWHSGHTFGHWAVTANRDGTITWTSRRTGRSYLTRPYDFRAGP